MKAPSRTAQLPVEHHLLRRVKAPYPTKLQLSALRNPSGAQTLATSLRSRSQHHFFCIPSLIERTKSIYIRARVAVLYAGLSTHNPLRSFKVFLKKQSSRSGQFLSASKKVGLCLMSLAMLSFAAFASDDDVVPDNYLMGMHVKHTNNAGGLNGKGNIPTPHGFPAGVDTLTNFTGH